MHRSWSKGFTKDTHPSLMKTSKTMKSYKVSNFHSWVQRMKEKGKIKSIYPEFQRDADLAELVGVILGDGHIQKFPRTDRLLIFSNSSNKGFVKRYEKLVKSIFQKQPYVYKQKQSNCTRISLYEKNISKRIGVPYSPRKNLAIRVPRWILAKDEYVVRYLRGLYEAEGSVSFHAKTYTHKLEFANLNQSMLANVFRLMKGLGFHPHRDERRVQISRKDEVMGAIKLLEFRKY